MKRTLTIERDEGPVVVEVTVKIVREPAEHFDGYGTRPPVCDLYIEDTSIPITAGEEAACIDELRQELLP